VSATAELTHLVRAMKAPAAARSMAKLCERARSEEWSYERFTEALLSTEIASRDASGGELRIKAARFPARKTLEEFDFTFQRSIKKQVIEHLGQLDFLHGTEWVALLADAQRQGRLEDELRRLERYPLLVCDEIGYIPFDPQAANLMFMLVSRRYERASLIVTSNKPFSAWGEIFGDDAVAVAMIDRLVHYAEILSLKGDSYRLKDRDLGRRPEQPTD
jgi:DNA replication protein DnaC